jgi:hypothetical protein
VGKGQENPGGCIDKGCGALIPVASISLIVSCFHYDMTLPGDQDAGEQRGRTVSLSESATRQFASSSSSMSQCDDSESKPNFRVAPSSGLDEPTTTDIKSAETKADVLSSTSPSAEHRRTVTTRATSSLLHPLGFAPPAPVSGSNSETSIVDAFQSALPALVGSSNADLSKVAVSTPYTPNPLKPKDATQGVLLRAPASAVLSSPGTKTYSTGASCSSKSTKSIPEFLYQLTKMLTSNNRDIIEWSNGKVTAMRNPLETVSKLTRDCVTYTGKIEVHNPHKLESTV